MSDRMLDRLGALSGILGGVLGMVGFSLFASGALAQALQENSKESVARAVASPSPGQAYLGISLDTLSSFLLVLFAARLWGRLRRAEGDPGWLSVATLAGFILGIAASLADKAAFYALAAQAGHGLEVQEAITLGHLAQAGFNLAGQYIGVLFLGCAAVVILRARALPRWLGWGAAVIAALNLVSLLMPPTVDFPRIGFWLVFLWLLVTSVVMLARPETPGVARESARLAAART